MSLAIRKGEEGDLFSIPRINVIESDEGFSVEVSSPTRVVYTEGARKLTADSEFLTGPSGLVLYTRSMKKWDDGSALDETGKARIIENIRRAFRYRGIEIEVM